MISGQAKSSFDHLFEKSVMANIVASTDDSCEIQPIGDPEEISEDEFVVLTISSPFFRVMACFHFSNDNSTVSHFAKRSNLDAEAIDNSAFRDAFLEFCNICCGTIQRDLHKHYQYLGMSTPYVLLKTCLSFISTLEPGYVRHYRITINHSLVLHATLCVCDYGVVDFEVDTSAAIEDTGELELF
ncbi:MAG: hypothetical protein Q7U57_08385 [Methylovulum sp.]|nr:hypothetical protein [Methylovulum sp.]